MCVYFTPTKRGKQLFETCLIFHYTFRLVLPCMRSVIPVNAPDAINKILVVSTWYVVSWAFRFPIFSVTLTTLDSKSLRNACWTPSPPTSREEFTPLEEFPGMILRILSTSSRYTIPVEVIINNISKLAHIKEQIYIKNL